jgi:rare lipoprotein A
MKTSPRENTEAAIFMSTIASRKSAGLTAAHSRGADKYTGDSLYKGRNAMCENLERDVAIGWTASSSAGMKATDNSKYLLKWVLWSLIVMILVISCLAGCEPAYGMEASWYSTSDLKRDGQWDITHGRTASGQLFTDSGFTAASWDFPLGTKVRVTRTDNKASVVVLVNDRTARRFKGKRIDLSKVAFGRIADINEGIVAVFVKEIK